MEKSRFKKSRFFDFWHFWNIRRAIAKKQEFSGYQAPSEKLRRQK